MSALTGGDSVQYRPMVFIDGNVSIGDFATHILAGSLSSVGIGDAVTIDGFLSDCIGIGRNVHVTAGSNISVGFDLTSLGSCPSNVTMGMSLSLDDGGRATNSNVLLGFNTTFTAFMNSVFIGDSGTFGTGIRQTVAIGTTISLADGVLRSLAFGQNASIGASSDLSVALGAGANIGANCSTVLSAGTALVGDTCSTVLAWGGSTNIAAGSVIVVAFNSIVGGFANTCFYSGAHATGTSRRCVSIGWNGTLLDGVENCVALGTAIFRADAFQCVAIGGSLVDIGDSASDMVGIGSDVTVGDSSSTGVAIGASSTLGVGTVSCMALLGGIVDDTLTAAMAIGPSAEVSGSYGIAVGQSAVATANQAVIGNSGATEAIHSFVVRGFNVGALDTLSAIDNPAAGETGLTVVFNTGIATANKTCKAALSPPVGALVLYLDP